MNADQIKKFPSVAVEPKPTRKRAMILPSDYPLDLSEMPTTFEEALAEQFKVNGCYAGECVTYRNKHNRKVTHEILISEELAGSGRDTLRFMMFRMSNGKTFTRIVDFA